MKMKIPKDVLAFALAVSAVASTAEGTRRHLKHAKRALAGLDGDALERATVRAIRLQAKWGSG